jgi:hypothetical protein
MDRRPWHSVAADSRPLHRQQPTTRAEFIKILCTNNLEKNTRDETGAEMKENSKIHRWNNENDSVHSTRRTSGRISMNQRPTNCNSKMAFTLSFVVNFIPPHIQISFPQLWKGGEISRKVDGITSVPLMAQ